MYPYQETFDSWNKVAALYEEKFMELPIYDETYDAFCEKIGNPAARVLDAGCGPGNISRYLRSKHPDFHLEGIDIAPNMVELARKNNPEGQYQVMDLREIYLLNGPFDGIICGFGLPYLSGAEVAGFIRNCRKLLSPTGILYLSWVEGAPENSGFVSGSSGDRMYFYYHRLADLVAQLRLSGFLDLRTFHVPYHRTALSTEIHIIVVAG